MLLKYLSCERYATAAAARRSIASERDIRPCPGVGQTQGGDHVCDLIRLKVLTNLTKSA